MPATEPRPRSPAQAEAARRNGARSRGPVTPEGKAKRVPVRTGLRDAGLVEVSGVPAGARVIGEGLVKVADGAGAYAVIGSMGGAPQHPQWVHNVRANPVARLQDGAEVQDYAVREVDGDEGVLAVASVEAFAELANLLAALVVELRFARVGALHAMRLLAALVLRGARVEHVAPL